jgi:Secretion system C-terminal sorting domain
MATHFIFQINCMKMNFQTLWISIVLPLFGVAQTSLNFETWSGIQPNGWTSANVMVGGFFGNNDTVCLKAVQPNVNSGNYAMKLETIVLSNNIASNIGVPDTVCFAFTGAIGYNLSTQSATLKMGYPFNTRPPVFDFFYKYAPVLGDSATAGIILTKRVGGVRDTVAIGSKHLGTQSTYVHDSVALNYRPAYLSGGNPDSAIIYFASSNIKSFTVTNDSMTIAYQNPQVGSMLWVDDCFFNWVGIKENTAENIRITAFPNPANNTMIVEFEREENRNVKITDMLGNIIQEVSVSGNKLIINTELLSPGTYFAIVSSLNEAGVGTLRFQVAH